MTLRFMSLCSGIDAASVAWRPLGWRPVAFSEIEPFPCEVLAHHYPEVPNYGDMTKFKDWPDANVDVLVGGTPCQSFSVAGLRKGLADLRGNLALVYLGIADRYRPKWILWENVPGVLSSNKGRDFGAFLGGLVELGYGFAYRVLDAQFVRVDGFGRAVPQRRRRVFVVGYLGDWRRAAAVLFDPASLYGDSAPRREAGQGAAPTLAARTRGGGGLGTDFDCDRGLICHDVAPTLNAHFGDKQGLEDQHINGGAGMFVAHALRADGFDASEDGTGRGTPLVPVHCFDARQSDVIQYGNMTGPLDTDGHTMAIAFSCKDHGADAGDISPTLRSMGHDGSHANAGGQVAVAFAQNQRDEIRMMDVAGALAAEPGMKQQTYVAQSHPYTLAIRGRGDGHNLEYRQDGTANAVLTPNGGRAGIGVGAIADGWAVRRLTPRECERLQGFPEFLDRVRIEVWHCFDHRQTNAHAGTPNPKLPKSASIVGGSASSQHANPAATASSTSRPGHDLPVVLNVLIDLERGEVQIRRAGRLIWSANTAAKPSASPLSMPTDAFVRLAAVMMQTAVPQTIDGRVELPHSINTSSPALLGSACVSASGQEIEELVSDAAKFGAVAEGCMKSITSPSGHNSPTCGLRLRTLSSCVTAAISSCIPSETRQANSYAVTVDLIRSFTAIPRKGGKPAADGPRYKALGNSMACNVMRWIGRRIADVENFQEASVT